MKKCPACRVIVPEYMNQCVSAVCKCGKFEQIDGVVFQYDNKGQLVRASRVEGWYED